MGRAVPAGGRAAGRPVRGPWPPHGAGPGAGPGGASSVLAPCQFGCSDLLRPPRPRPATCGFPSPRSPAPRAAAAAATAARRAPPAAPAPCRPAAWARPPNPRGGRRRCCPYCCSASSGRREPDQEPVSTRRPAPPFPPGRRACALGAAAGGGGAGATWTAREQRKAPPARPSGRRHLRGARRCNSPAGGSSFRARGLLTWAAEPRTPGPAPQTLGGRGLGSFARRDSEGARDSVRGLRAAVTAGHLSRAGAHAVGALGAGLDRAPLPEEG